MKNYDFYLFDWDGNLAKSLDVWLVATRYPLEKRGIHLTDKGIAQLCFGRPHEGYAELGIVDVDEAIFEMDEKARELMPEVELYPDAVFVLETLRQEGKQTALITTSLRHNVIRLLDKYNLHHFFDVIITNEDTKHHKPHPEPLELALTQLNARHKESVMIGDSDKDIGAANNAQIDSILFYPNSHEKFYQLNDLIALHPTHIVHNFSEIVA